MEGADRHQAGVLLTAECGRQYGMSDPPLLSTNIVTVSVDGRVILAAATCEVAGGECVGILGPNGAGKSTLLHAVVGLMPVSSGTITIGGHQHHTRAAKRVLGWVPDDLPMTDSLTGSEVSLLHQRLRGAAFDRALCDELFTVLGLDPHLHRPCGDYSHGMRRKLSLAMALAHRPRLLILDEPFRGLDPLTAALLRGLLQLHAERGHAVLMATHDLDQAAHLCDRVLLLDGGQVLASGTPRQIVRRQCRQHAPGGVPPRHGPAAARGSGDRTACPAVGIAEPCRRGDQRVTAKLARRAVSLGLVAVVVFYTAVFLFALIFSEDVSVLGARASIVDSATQPSRSTSSSIRSRRWWCGWGHR